jgi:ubiquinone/menaquinone biosynthesis C-methylase UbiE
MTAYIAEHIGGMVTAIDLSAELVTAARKTLRLNGCPTTEVRTADITALPFEDGSFETVTAFEVLEHLADPLAAMRECRRVGKTLFATVPAEGAMTETEGHLQDFEIHDLEDSLRSAGFRRVSLLEAWPFVYIEAS